jgi:hypothetical protein
VQACVASGRHILALEGDDDTFLEFLIQFSDATNNLGTLSSTEENPSGDLKDLQTFINREQSKSRAAASSQRSSSHAL